MVHYDDCFDSYHNEPLSCMGAKALQPTHFLKFRLTRFRLSEINCNTIIVLFSAPIDTRSEDILSELSVGDRSRHLVLMGGPDGILQSETAGECPVPRGIPPQHGARCSRTQDEQISGECNRSSRHHGGHRIGGSSQAPPHWKPRSKGDKTGH